MNETYTTTIDYPLRYSFNKEKFVPINFPSREIDVNVTGNGWNLLRYSMGFNMSPVEVDLNNLPENSSFPAANLEPVIAERLKELKVNYIAKDTIRFQFDYRGRKVVQVKIDSTQIPLVSGYRITSPVRVEPSRIIIRGPASRIDTLNEVVTLSIPEKRIDESYNDDLSVGFLNDTLFELSDTEVNVRFTVKPYISHSVQVPVSVVNSDTTNSRDSLVVKPSQVDVKFLWPEEGPSVPQSNDFKVVANYEKRNPEDSTVVPELKEEPGAAEETVINPLKVKLFYGSR